MMKIAYLGPENTNTHIAARAVFGARARYVHAPTVEDVFRLVEREQADAGVVPIENSLEGTVTHTLDRFIEFKQSPLSIQGEIEQPIKHFLLLHSRTELARIRVVYSHPQALAQCHLWLQQHLPRVTRWETNSTAEAVQYLWDQAIGGRWALEERAAIARLELGKEGMRVVAIPDARENKTRFLIVGLTKPRRQRGRRSKTSILFALKDKPGALYDALAAFDAERINLTKIESRPSKRKAWEYYFFIDLEGHESDPRVQRALKALRRTTTLLRILGSYPTAR